MHNSLQMPILLPTNFLQIEIIFVFPGSFLRTTYQVEYPWGHSRRFKLQFFYLTIYVMLSNA